MTGRESIRTVRLFDNRATETYVLAYDFPLLSMGLLLLWWFFLLSVFFAVIWAFIDNFRRHDHSGWAKAGWALVIILIPLLGTCIYLIARGAGSDAEVPA
jgi:hypothetical protein